jgi:hypothetical protein
LVFASSFFSGAGATSFIGSPGFWSPAGGAGSAGAAGAGAGGGGGGAGSSFLPHPNVRVNAKRVIADNKTSFFPILIHLLSRHTFTKLSLLRILYRTSRREFQAQMPANLIPGAQRFCSISVDSSAAFVPTPENRRFNRPCNERQDNFQAIFANKRKHFHRNFWTKCRYKTMPDNFSEPVVTQATTRE